MGEGHGGTEGKRHGGTRRRAVGPFGLASGLKTRGSPWRTGRKRRLGHELENKLSRSMWKDTEHKVYVFGERLVFSPNARPNSPAARRRAPPPVFPPFHLALHSSLTYTLALLSFHSTRLDLAFFRGRARASVFGACAMGEPLIFGPDARPNSHAARRLAPPCRFPSVPPCRSPKT